MKRPPAADFSDPNAPRPVRGFALSQRRAIAGLLVIFLACLIVGLIRNPTFVDDPLPQTARLGDALDDRLDPNVADARSLGALPNLGARRARDIVAYRERLLARDPSRVAFRTPEDLLRVDGVGVAIVAQLRPFLRFPATAPTTRE